MNEINKNDRADMNDDDAERLPSTDGLNIQDKTDET
jgi:hypothetical protein